MVVDTCRKAFIVIDIEDIIMMSLPQISISSMQPQIQKYVSSSLFNLVFFYTCFFVRKDPVRPPFGEARRILLSFTKYTELYTISML